MDPATVNTFLDRFLALADQGFGLIAGDVGAVLNALIVISIVLAGVQWILAAEAPMAPFFRKVLFVGLFAWLINNWDYLASVINRSGAMLGLKAGGGSMSMSELHDPGRIAQSGIDMFGRTVALSEGMTIFTDAIAMALIFLAAVIVAFGFFLLALQVFAALIAFKLGALAAFVALPWGVFNGTAWVAERPLGWVAGCAIRLFLLAFVASVSITFVDTLPDSFVLADGGALQVLFFGLTMSMLAWFAPQLASEVVQGQPQLSGADGVRAVTGAGSTAAGAGFVASRAGGGLYRLGKSAIGFARGGRGPRGGGAGGARPVPIDYARMKPPPTGSKS